MSGARTGKPAVLALEDGTLFHGSAFGAEAEAEGEVVFNTAMTGYQEVLTDPSYRGQIVVMTAPQIGNTGINADDFESRRCFSAGFVVRDLSQVTSSWRAQRSLPDLMAEQGVTGLSGIDTRALTRRLRQNGSLRGLITSALPRSDAEAAELGRRAAAVPSLEGRDLVKEVTAEARYSWDQPSYRFAGDPVAPATDVHIVAYDFGIKRGILHRLRDRGCRVTVLPARTPAAEALALRPDGVFLSNGPADPAAVTYGIDATREVIAAGVPLFGICLGHQILGLALGGRTFKLKFGHHGANHPVLELATGKVEITSQNHGFCVDMDSLAGKAELTHVNLNDRTVEGMAVPGRPVFSVQYHPEASPGPHDADYLFRRFLAHVRGDAQAWASGMTDSAGLAHAEIGRLIDAVVAEHSRGDYAAEVVRAKHEFFERCGPVFEDDDLYDSRMAAFLEWYAVERPLGSAVPGTGQTPVERLGELSLATSHRSLFEVRALPEAAVVIEDLVGGGLYSVDERRRIAGLAEGDIFEARLYGLGGRVVFGRCFLPHERGAADAIRELARRAALAAQGGDSAARGRLCERLATLRVKSVRYKNVPVARIYGAETEGGAR